MSEIINSYPLDNPDKLIPMDRKKFYSEQVEVFKSEWNPSKAVEVINVFLFNEAWEVILQKRSNTKRHNPNLLDKSVWWHVVNGDTPDFTVMLETVQELQVPSIVLRSRTDFLKTYYLLKDYTNSTSIIEHLASDIFHVEKVINKEKIIIANKTHLYMWIYGGSIKNVDKEAKWVLFYDLDELFEEFEQFPDLFTEDIKFFFKKYETDIRSFIELVVKK